MFENFAPPFLKEFLPFISPNALKVLPLPELLKTAYTVTPNFLSGEGRGELIAAMRLILPEGIELVDQWSRSTTIALEKLTEEEKKQLGEKILELYFLQIYSSQQLSQRLFLDLRLSQFRWEPEKKTLLWCPNTLWATHSVEFIEAVQNLYTGFYRNSPAHLNKSLPVLRLTAEAGGTAEHERIVSLLREHFGSGLTQPFRFKVENLVKSFHSIFDSIFASGRQIHPEFSLLGLYITSLYLGLSPLGVELDVRNAYLLANKEAAKA